MRRASAFTALLVAGLVTALGLASTAAAKDPGKWILTGASSVPNAYFQGLTSNPDDPHEIWFDGPQQGLWRTDLSLHEDAGVAKAIPAAVNKREGYNHIGDPSFLPGEGGRIVLPMECYSPSQGNTCGTGAFGIADPETLAFRYYVKLDPHQIQKAMWAETSPDRKLIWTSSGDDLLAYRTSDVVKANRAPGGPLLRAARRLKGAVPPTGVTGAVFSNGRLLLAGASNHLYQVWSVDTTTGQRRLELQMRICGESEGLDIIPTLGGALQWLISPVDPGCQLTFPPTSALLHFAPPPGARRYEVTATNVQVGTLPGNVQVTVRATFNGDPVAGAVVEFAGAVAQTNVRGLAKVSTTLELPGRFAAVVHSNSKYGISKLVDVGVQSSQPVPAPHPHG
jgi:hypothetical protein